MTGCSLPGSLVISPMRVLSLLTPVVLTSLAAACGASAPGVSAPSNAVPTISLPIDAAAPPPDRMPSAGAGSSASLTAETRDAAAELSDAAPGVYATSGLNAVPGSSPSPSSESACNEQDPQDFLVRGNFLKDGRAGLDRAIQYRTEQYGYFKGFGRPGPGALPPSANVVTTTFMGLPVRMHRKVVPALHCVEEEISRACVDHPYTPHALAGIRFRNTYRGGEVTNHAYGIAIDVDPSINTCCGCVKPWNDAPACKRHARSEYDRMAMPECWVHAFERYGFYWLGHDVLRDTMHFEFLGDPARILKNDPSSTAVRADAGVKREGP
jgi:hypothetical protein